MSPILSPASRRQLIQQLAGSIGQLETAGQLARRLQGHSPAALPASLPTGPDRSPAAPPSTATLSTAPPAPLPPAVSFLSPGADRDSSPQHKPGAAPPAPPLASNPLSGNPLTRLPATPVSANSAPHSGCLHESPFAPLLGPAGWPRGGLLEIQSLGWGAGGLTLVLAILRELIPNHAPLGELSRHHSRPTTGPGRTSRRAKTRAATSRRGTNSSRTNSQLSADQFAADQLPGNHSPNSQPGDGLWAIPTRKTSLAPPATSPAGVVLIDTDHQLYAPALVAWGLSPESTVVVRPRNSADALWACEQALRNRGVAAVWCHNTRWTPRHLRRLHLAARTGQSLGLITSFPEQHASPAPSAQRRWRITPLLPASPTAEASSPELASQELRARQEPRGATDCQRQETGPDAREWPGGLVPERGREWPREREQEREFGGGLASVARRWRVEQVHPRNSPGGGCVELECSYETGAVRLVSPLAAAAGATRPART